MRNKLLAMIHIAEKDLGLDRETYRHMLRTVTGKSTCKDLSNQQLEQVLTHLKANGWKPTKTANKKYSPRTSGKVGTDQVDKIRALWIEMSKRGAIADGSEKALSHWVTRTTRKMNGGQGVESVEWLRNHASKQLCNQVLESLKKWKRRVELEWQNEDLREINACQRRYDISEFDAAQQLLTQHRIFWWPLFNAMNIADSHEYCTCRAELKHG